ncbi:MAG: hypothetical protein JNK04_04210, partial [Myxococcales bacterium]|nr:hypothetical protein [Myxococcales bacterium]
MATLHGSKATIDIAGDAYDVLYARIDERLDTIPRLEARLWKEGDLPKPKTLLNGEVSFQLGSEEAFDSGRKFTGKVIEAERRFDSAGRPFVRVVVSPAPFNATKRTDVRTYQKLKVDEIVKKSVEGGGIKARFSLTGSYEPRDYVVQYRETDFDFVRRICSEEGIAFTFDHESGEMVFFDDPHGLGDAPEKTLTYHAEFGFEQAAASVFKLHQVGRVVTDKVFLREYDPARPRFNVEGEAEGTDDGEHGLEAYCFPSRSIKESVTKQFAQVLLDSIQCRRDIVDGSMTSWSLSPGYRFAIEGHPLEELNVELLAIATTLEHFNERSQAGSGLDGGASRTVATFEAIPTARSNYRPERRPRARTLPGVQTGVTT